MRTIPAIKTEYKGRYFRSRLEARWAVFFDLICLPWEYEIVGMDMDGAWYLPDFHLPTCDAHVEVKPFNVTRKEGERLAAIVCAASQTKERLYVLRGVPDHDNHRITVDAERGEGRFMQCRKCAGVCIVGQFGDWWMEIGEHTCGDHDWWPLYDYRKEFNKAKAMKFDHIEAKSARDVARAWKR